MDSINRKLILSDQDNKRTNGGVDGESPEFKYQSRHADDEKMRDSRRRQAVNSKDWNNGADSLQELLKNSKFDVTGDQKGFMGEGISPDKKTGRP